MAFRLIEMVLPEKDAGKTRDLLKTVYGVFMTPLGWGWAAFVWGYALLWFLVNDRVKLLAYRVFDPTAAPLLVGKSVRAYALHEQQGRC